MFCSTVSLRKARLEKETAHQPAARDCLRCHVPHMSSNDSLMKQPILPLCGECHATGRANFGAAHLNIDPSVMDCRSCHDPHASTDPKLFKANVHMPFAARACEDCHIP